MEQAAQMTVRERLLDEWQRNFPLVARPFGVMAEQLGISQSAVLEALVELRAEGAISRVGGVVRPNTLGASTLAAISVPDLQADAIAQYLSAEPGINHVYLRENDWNLWVVVTGPNRAYVDEVLQRIEQKTGFRVLDLRLEKPYHIDLGFTLHGRDNKTGARIDPAAGLHAPYEPNPMDRRLVQVLTQGLPLVPEPFVQIGTQIGCGQDEVLERLRTLVAAGIVPRIGVIVRHRALGWRSNAMVVWDVGTDAVDGAGAALSSVPGINLCYRRKRYAHAWPYNLYCMVHAKCRQDALDKLLEAEELAGLQGLNRQILFSLRCYKQTGAMLALPREAA